MQRGRGHIIGALLLAVAGARAGTPPALEPVEVSGMSTAAREQKSVALLLGIRAAFEKHRALAPNAELRVRIYPRHDDADLKGADLEIHAEGLRRAVALDEQQRFEIDPGWAELPAGAVLRSRAREGLLAWHPDIRTPGLPPHTRRLGDLRLECRVDARGLPQLARGIVTPGYLALTAMTEVCAHFNIYGYFADVPLFGVTLVDGQRRQRLRYELLYGSMTGQRHLLHGLLDWPYRLRDRFYMVPLDDASWPDDTLVVLEPMEEPGEHS